MESGASGSPEVRLRTVFPQVGGLATLPDKTLVSGETIGGPDGLQARCVCILRTGKSCYGQNQTEVSPDHEHQEERNSVKLLLCSRQMSLPNLVVDPALMVKGVSPWYLSLGPHVPRSRGLHLPAQAVALCTCPSAAAYSEICHQREVPGVKSASLNVWL